MSKVRALLKPWAHRLLFPAVTAVWTMLFRLVGLVLRPQARAWYSPGDETVLVVAPHPDDETLGCGGVIALHRRAGDRVYVLIVTDGGSSGAAALGRDEIARVRGREAVKAVGLLGEGIKLISLALPEGLWSPGELVERLSNILLELRPTVIYTTSCVDFHPEHVGVAAALASSLRATREQNCCRDVRIYEVQVPLTPLLVNVLADVEGVNQVKHQALQAYSTQLPALPWVPRHERYMRALYRRSGAVEAFWQMSPDEFRRVMQQARRRSGGACPYRSLRLRPFTDGLAWLVGIRDRQRLRWDY
jgi:LmbE family N-acetylglucosaminyl deacetylase